MKQIRTGVFETNSSSVHSICISKSNDLEKHAEVYFGLGDYGWAEKTLNTYAERAAYLWTAILDCYGYGNSVPKVEEYKQKITEMLNSEGIQCNFAKYKIKKSDYDNQKYCEHNGYIDHGDGTANFVNAVLKDKDKLFRYLFSPDSVVYTGNDNVEEFNYQTYGVASKMAYDDEYNRVLNIYHDEEKYEYFYKGN